MLPELPPLPALTRAEAELIDRYLEVVDLLGRVNPAQGGDTYRGLRAAQALVGKAVALRDALTLMHRRGESELHAETLASGAPRGSRCRRRRDVDRSGPGATGPLDGTLRAELKRTERRTPVRRRRTSFFRPSNLRTPPRRRAELTVPPLVLASHALLTASRTDGCPPERVSGE